MKKILYITINSFEKTGNGINDKILLQIQAFADLGYSPTLICLDQKYVVTKNHDGEIIQKFRFVRYFQFVQVAQSVKKLSTQYDIVYIRNPLLGIQPIYVPYLLKILEKKTDKIFLEIPNFPYEGEARTAKQKVPIICQKLTRWSIRKNVKRILYTGELTPEIWGVPATRIVNAPSSTIQMARAGISNRGEISFVGVANLSFWHGYDRLIWGIHNYYNNGGAKNITFNIVGDSEPEFTKLKNLACQLRLGDKVKFFGRLCGDELDRVFAASTIGVDSLGRHRAGNDYNDSIKSKEYAMRGLPFIKSHSDDSFSDCVFVYTVSANEAPIMIESIIEWVLKQEIRPEQIREYAVKRFSWKSQFESLLRTL